MQFFAFPGIHLRIYTHPCVCMKKSTTIIFTQSFVRVNCWLVAIFCAILTLIVFVTYHFISFLLGSFSYLPSSSVLLSRVCELCRLRPKRIKLRTARIAIRFSLTTGTGLPPGVPASLDAAVPPPPPPPPTDVPPTELLRLCDLPWLLSARCRLGTIGIGCVVEDDPGVVADIVGI